MVTYDRRSQVDRDSGFLPCLWHGSPCTFTGEITAAALWYPWTNLTVDPVFSLPQRDASGGWWWNLIDCPSRFCRPSRHCYGVITIFFIHQWPTWTGIPRYCHMTVCWWLPDVPGNQLSRLSGYTPTWLNCTRQLGKDLGHAIQPVKMHYTPISHSISPFIYNYQMCGEALLEECEAAKYLGVTISNALTWSSNVAYVTKKPAILWTSYVEIWNIVQYWFLCTRLSADSWLCHLTNSSLRTVERDRTTRTTSRPSVHRHQSTRIPSFLLLYQPHNNPQVFFLTNTLQYTPIHNIVSLRIVITQVHNFTFFDVKTFAIH